MTSLIQEGTHPAVALSHQFGKAGTDDKPNVGIMFKIIDGPDKGRTIPWFGYFTAKTFERTCESLRYCGWKGTDIANLGTLDQIVDLDVAHEEYEEKQRARVNWVNRHGGMSLKNPMNEAEIAKLAAKLKSKALKIPEVDGIKHTESEASDNSVASGDEPPPPSDEDFDWS